MNEYHGDKSWKVFFMMINLTSHFLISHRDLPEWYKETFIVFSMSPNDECNTVECVLFYRVYKRETSQSLSSLSTTQIRNAYYN